MPLRRYRSRIGRHASMRCVRGTPGGTHVTCVASRLISKAHAMLAPDPRAEVDMYEPWDALEAPGVTGPRTYARLPYVTESDGWTRRVRSALGRWHFFSAGAASAWSHSVASGIPRCRPRPARSGVRALSTVDFGDAPMAPGYFEDSLNRIQAFVTPLVEQVRSVWAWAETIRSTRRVPAPAEVDGRLGLVHLDLHIDLDAPTTAIPTRTAPCSGGRLGGRPDPARLIQAGTGLVVLREDRDISSDLGVNALTAYRAGTLPSPDKFAYEYVANRKRACAPS